MPIMKRRTLLTRFAISSSSSSSSSVIQQKTRKLSSSPFLSKRYPYKQDTDRLIVIGSGVAGCTTALVAAEKFNIPVTLLYAGSVPTDCNSYWAQGGIIYRNYHPHSKDSPESLVKDIQRAGAGLCSQEAVWKVALDGPSWVQQILLHQDSNSYCNVPFDRDDHGHLAYTLEASHSAPRIIYSADHTGKVITDTITSAVQKHPNITMIPNTIVTDLILSRETETDEEDKNYPNSTSPTSCVGVQVMNTQTHQPSSLFGTRGIVIASGGVAGIYEHSTNPSGFNALGSSLAMALRAGASTCDLEYIQFHPTVLYVPNQPRFLLTEALRGEGAILRNASGYAFAKDFHPDRELAPRDIVSRGVFYEMQKSILPEKTTKNIPVCYLDITHRESTWLKRRFPSIDAHLQRLGLDITKDHLPITPAAHYTCGGVTTDLHGRTNIHGLYCAGEAARTGLHGGNRLASTSLLEGLVFGAAVADFVGGSVEGKESWDRSKQYLESPSFKSMNHHNKETKDINANLDDHVHRVNVERSKTLLNQVKQIMWDHVGVVRTVKGLHHAKMELCHIKEEAMHLFQQSPTVETSALRDAAIAAEAVTLSASTNKVSAGAHCIILEESDVEQLGTLPTATVSAG